MHPTVPYRCTQHPYRCTQHPHLCTQPFHRHGPKGYLAHFACQKHDISQKSCILFIIETISNDLEHDHDLDHNEDMFTKYWFSMVFGAAHGQQVKPIVEKLTHFLSYLISYPNQFWLKVETWSVVSENTHSYYTDLCCTDLFVCSHSDKYRFQFLYFCPYRFIFVRQTHDIFQN